MMQVSQVMTRGVRTRPVRSLGGQRRDGRRSDCQDVGQTGAAMSRDPLSARTLRRRAAAGAVLPRVLVVAVALALVAGFALLNWQQLAVAVPVSLGVVTVDAPLGLIMLVLLAALALVFIAWALTLQGSVLLESRRHAREMQAQRELADRAEASRFTELRQHLREQVVLFLAVVVFGLFPEHLELGLESLVVGVHGHEVGEQALERQVLLERFEQHVFRARRLHRRVEHLLLGRDVHRQVIADSSEQLGALGTLLGGEQLPHARFDLVVLIDQQVDGIHGSWPFPGGVAACDPLPGQAAYPPRGQWPRGTSGGSSGMRPSRSSISPR